MTMADTVAVMNAGRIEQLGHPVDLYERPRTAFVANFLGQSNLVAGTVEDGRMVSGTVGVRAVAGASRPLLVPVDRMAATSGPVLVGVRPEKIHLLHGDGAAPGDEGAPSGVNVLGPGRVTDVSFAGVSTQYMVEVAGVGPLTVFSQNVDGPRAREGDLVRLAWPVAHTFGLDGHQDASAGREED